MRVRFTPYWALVGGHGCVREAPGGLDRGAGPRAGQRCTSVIGFSLARVFRMAPLHPEVLASPEHRLGFS